MKIRLLIDMNLSPGWVEYLKANHISAVHWSDAGDPHASDHEILNWARENNHVVFTHDLDFGTLLALTHELGPSTLQVRSQNVLPDHLGPFVLAALKQHEADLIQGAVVVVDEARSRVRVLPI